MLALAETLLLFAIPIFLIAIMIEWRFTAKRQPSLYNIRDTIACLAMGTGNVLISAVTAALIFALYNFAYEFRVFEFSPYNAWSWLVLLFAEDFCYYWFHRVHHESRIGWAGHVNHHSSTHYNLAVALRQSWTTRFTGAFFWIPLALLGFDPVMILLQQSVSLIYQFWIHTQTIKQLPRWIEAVFNTPSHHRVHHGSNPEYIDRNYGGIFIIWDRLFASFEPERAVVNYGLTRNISSYNPLIIAFHEWRSMIHDMLKCQGIGNKLRCLFKHPKWFSEQIDAAVHPDNNASQ